LILPSTLDILNQSVAIQKIAQPPFQIRANNRVVYQAFKEAEMSYPFDEETSIEDERELDLGMLREDLIAELQAINQYQEHIEALEDEQAIRILEQIRDDEKEHVAELVKLIQMLDPVQAEKFTRGML
jgi:hypothetical protein